MSDRDETPVTVTLARDRMYRAKHEDRTAITVKKGIPTEVPAWVAKEWGLGTEQAKPAAAAEPQGIAFLQEAGYDDMNVLEAVEYLQSLTETERRIALQYEKRNKNRGTVFKEFN